MKEKPSAVSPFAALDTREQMEQWIWWQTQQPREQTSLREIEPQEHPQPLHAPEEQRSPAAQTIPAYTPPPIHRGQYRAVLQRMNAAQRRTVDYIACTQEVSMTRQSLSGNP